MTTTPREKCCEKCTEHKCWEPKLFPREIAKEVCVCPCHTTHPSEEPWENWKENFCKHISGWSYFSAHEELDRIKSTIFDATVSKAVELERERIREKIEEYRKQESAGLKGTKKEIFEEDMNIILSFLQDKPNS